MASLFILLVMMAFMFLLVGARDIWDWFHPKDEVTSVDRWNKFREISEENRNDEF